MRFLGRGAKAVQVAKRFHNSAADSHVARPLATGADDFRGAAHVRQAPLPSPPVGRSHLRDDSAARERSLRLDVLSIGAAGRVCPPTLRLTDPLSGNVTIGNAKR